MSARAAAAGALLALVALASAGCGGGGEPVADIRLDGSARVPDQAGIVDAVTLKKITVDGTTTPLSRRLLAFSTYTLEALPVLQTKGAYVHVGTKDGKAVWVALVAKPLGAGPRPPSAFYNGTILRAKGSRIVFQDGTVLEAAKGVVAPPAGTRVLAEIDIAHDRVSSLRG